MKILKLQYKDITLEQRQASKLRGFFANKYKNILDFHNHIDDNFKYSYPLIQYKVLESIPTIIAIDEGTEIINSVDIDNEIIIDNKKLISNTTINEYTEDFSVVNGFLEYEFISPWLSFNQKNSKIYKTLDEEQKNTLLTKILIGNILSMAKSLNYVINEEIVVGINLSETSVFFKNQKMRAFKGNFCTNINIPDYLGLGKSVSKGFGTIKKI